MSKNIQTKSKVRKEICMIDKNEVYKMFFDDKLKQCEIAKRLGVSKQYIGQVLKAHPKASSEKERRSSENAKNRIEYQKNYQKKYKRKNTKDDCYEQMLAQLAKDTKELSYKDEISDYSFAKWNRGMYNYDKKSSDLVLKRNIVVSFDVPKRVRNVINPVKRRVIC